MYAIKRFSLALLLCAVLAPRTTYADCTISPAFFPSIAGSNQDNTADLDLFANYASQCAVFNPAATGRIRFHERVLMGDTWSNATTSVIDFLTLQPAYTSSADAQITGFRSTGAYTKTSGANTQGLYGVLVDFQTTSATGSVTPIQSVALGNTINIICNAANCGAAGTFYGFRDTPYLAATGASGSMSLNLTELELAPSVNTDNGAGTMTLTTRKGLHCAAPSLVGPGASTVGTSGCLDLDDQTATNVYGLRSAITSGSNKYFLKDDGGAQSKLTGKFTTYNGVATAGYGVPAIVGAGRSTAQTAAKASVATFTVGAADGTFRVSSNVLVTTSTVHSFTVTCAYTDEGNTARTITLTFSQLGGTLGTSIANAAGAVPYEGVPLHIRAKASTAITIATTGTFTTVTYNVEGLIEQLS